MHVYLNHLWNSYTILILGASCASMHGLAKHLHNAVVAHSVHMYTHARVDTATMESPVS